MAVNNGVIYPLFGKRGHPHKTSHRKHQKRQWNRNPSGMDAERQNIEQQERLATADCWGNISSKCANRNFWIPASVSISPVIPPPPPSPPSIHTPTPRVSWNFHRSAPLLFLHSSAERGTRKWRRASDYSWGQNRDHTTRSPPHYTSALVAAFPIIR